jgi:hypothetical protein
VTPTHPNCYWTQGYAAAVAKEIPTILHVSIAHTSIAGVATQLEPHLYCCAYHTCLGSYSASFPTWYQEKEAFSEPITIGVTLKFIGGYLRHLTGTKENSV